MTNGEKYKTAKERAEAFLDWCVAKTDFSKCKNCVIVHDCDCCPARGVAYWLDLEAEEEKPLPCPFCGEESVKVLKYDDCNEWRVYCECGYSSTDYKNDHDAIAAHNRVAKAIKESEAK